MHGLLDYSIVICVLLLILLVWITIVLTRDRQDPQLKLMKKMSIRDGLISREILADLVRDSILKGRWSP